MTDCQHHHEHIVVRVNDGWYMCPRCGDAGSQKWADIHQFGGGQMTDLPDETLEGGIVIDWNLVFGFFGIGLMLGVMFS